MALFDRDKVFSLLSSCGTGALAVNQEGRIEAVNEAGCRLLKLAAPSEIKGKPFPEAVPFLAAMEERQEESSAESASLMAKSGSSMSEPGSSTAESGSSRARAEGEAGRIRRFDVQEESAAVYLAGFDRYLELCGIMPGATRLIMFRDVSDRIHYDMVRHVLDHVSEAVTIWDEEGRMVMINDAAVRQEGHVERDAVGRRSQELFETRNNSILAIPKVLETRQPLLNLRQDYVTETGKELQIISQNYPILKDGRLLGAVSIMEDYTRMDELNRKIIDLQRRLRARSDAAPSSGKSMLTAKYTFRDILFASASMRRAVDRCRQAALTDSPVMLYGETGCGKELFAQSIHNASPRAKGPFLAVNCAAIPTTLLESILFGTEKGAYTGAGQHEGLFEQAHTGTLLLDEINSMDVVLQSKLLRVLQEGSFMRVGGSRLINVDVRVISNINVPPLKAVEEGTLRQDLYYRLGVVGINIPPLRERREDIPLLVNSFISELSAKIKKNIRAVSPEVCEIFARHGWPGNVRELRHAVEYAMNIVPLEQDVLKAEDLPDNILQAAGHAPSEKGDGGSMTGEGGGRLPGLSVVSARAQEGVRLRSEKEAAGEVTRLHAGGRAEAPAEADSLRIPTADPDTGAETLRIPAADPDEGALRISGADLDAMTLEEVLERAGREYLAHMLQRNDGNVSRAARAMGITRQNLQHRMKRYGVQADDGRKA